MKVVKSGTKVAIRKARYDIYQSQVSNDARRAYAQTPYGCLFNLNKRSAVAKEV